MALVVQAEQANPKPRQSRPDLGPDYRARFLEPDWAEKRRACLDRQGRKCAGCGRADVPLQGHHLSYRRFDTRAEEWFDLIGVCADCHPYADRLRKMQKRRKLANVIEVITWARAQGLHHQHPGCTWVEWFALRHAWMLAHLPGYIAKEREREEKLALSAGGPAT